MAFISKQYASESNHQTITLEKNIVSHNFSVHTLDDFRLIDSAQLDNNESAYALLMERYKKTVYYVILKVVRNVDDAEDLTMMTFTKAFKNLKSFHKENTFGTWILRIATNNAIDFIRKRKLNTYSIDNHYTTVEGDERMFELEDKDLTPDNEMIKDQRVLIIKKIINRLPAKYQRLVRLRYFEELGYSEISKITDTPEGTLKAQLYRARELMYEFFKKKKVDI